jgi:hypothetical protein
MKTDITPRPTMLTPHEEIVHAACDHYKATGKIPSPVSRNKHEKHIAYRLCGLKASLHGEDIRHVHPSLQTLAKKLGCPKLFSLKKPSRSKVPYGS